MKKYIWAFPGMGKSYINNKKIVDVDCEQFKYILPAGAPNNLHNPGEWEEVLSNPEYPENYFKYIDGLDAEIVLINCHVSLLDRLDKENVLIAYPCEDLMPEYLQRYKDRGDNSSFVSHMATEAKGIIEFIRGSDYKKYEIYSENTYLQDLFERNDFKVKVMTRKEITESLQKAIDLNVLDLSFNGDIVCDISLATAENHSSQNYDALKLTEDVLNGAYSLDIDQLNKVCAEREAQIEREKVMFERRGGLSRVELEDKIMQGIVNGALSIYYGQIAPYSHGYNVSFAENSWYCYCKFFEIPGIIANSIEKGDRANSFDITKLLASVNEMEEKQITKFVPEKETNFVRWGSQGYGSRGSIATVRDVHNGKGLDGIVQHHYHGDYSSMTPSAQNSLVETLVFMKGFCLDCLNGLDIGPDGRGKVVEYLKKHGTDISTPKKLNEWIKANPEKCGREENRVVKQNFNSGHELYAQAYCDFIELKSIVDNFKGSFEEACKELGGDRYDDNTFRLEYGVLAISIGRDFNNEIFLCDNAIGIWDESRGEFMEDCVSFKYLKETCQEIGYEIKALETKALEKNKLSLDEQLKSAESRVSASEGKISSPELGL